MPKQKPKSGLSDKDAERLRKKMDLFNAAKP